MTLSPEFDPDTTEYSAETENATNSITATPEDEDATVVITCGEQTYESGDSITWEEGENLVTIEVTSGTEEMTYEITVTKSEEEDDDDQ